MSFGLYEEDCRWPMLPGMEELILSGGKKPLPGKRMTLAQCRKVAPEFKDVRDEQLLEMRDLAYEYAEIIFEAWHDKKRGSKSPRESLTPNDESVDS